MVQMKILTAETTTTHHAIAKDKAKASLDLEKSIEDATADPHFHLQSTAPASMPRESIVIQTRIDKRCAFK